MNQNDRNDNHPLLKQYRGALAAQIRVDIARALRDNPHIAQAEIPALFAEMTREHKLDSLIGDLAREEAEAAAARGEIPPAAVMLLAGYRVSPMGQC